MPLNNSAEQKLNRLKWQCRRGQLELDLILNGFLERGYADLSEAEQDAFARLLQLPDRTLLRWLVGSKDSHAVEENQEIFDAELRDLVKKFR